MYYPIAADVLVLLLLWLSLMVLLLYDHPQKIQLNCEQMEMCRFSPIDVFYIIYSIYFIVFHIQLAKQKGKKEEYLCMH